MLFLRKEHLPVLISNTNYNNYHTLLKTRHNHYNLNNHSLYKHTKSIWLMLMELEVLSLPPFVFIVHLIKHPIEYLRLLLEVDQLQETITIVEGILIFLHLLFNHSLNLISIILCKLIKYLQTLNYVLHLPIQEDSREIDQMTILITNIILVILKEIWALRIVIWISVTIKITFLNPKQMEVNLLQIRDSLINTLFWREIITMRTIMIIMLWTMENKIKILLLIKEQIIHSIITQTAESLTIITPLLINLMVQVVLAWIKAQDIQQGDLFNSSNFRISRDLICRILLNSNLLKSSKEK